MKTAEEFIKEIGSSDALKNELKALKDKDALDAFLKAHGCGATAVEFVKLVKAGNEGEISDEAASEAAGGYNIPMPYHIFAGVLGTSTKNFDW